jgi:phospholipid-binding lipoprotein MlaA
MLNSRRVRVLLGVVLAMSAAGCVTLPPNAKPAPQDPWESWNRGVYRVNDAIDRNFAKPVAKTYVRAVPAPVRTGISNMQSNLRVTTVMVNNALQGKFLAAGSDLARFVVNLTVGVGGLLDPATQMGLDRHDNDFGQTLGHYGVPPGPFVEIPFLGPSTARDAPARAVDFFTGPTHYIKNNGVAWGLYGVFLLDTRASVLSLDETLSKVYDPYAFIRDAYLQRRAYLISGGKTAEEEPLEDPGADQPESPKTDSTKTPPPPSPTTPPPTTPPPEAPPKNPL